VEVSAKTGQNIDGLFTKVVQIFENKGMEKLDKSHSAEPKTLTVNFKNSHDEESTLRAESVHPLFARHHCEEPESELSPLSRPLVIQSFTSSNE
jgi:hypothetical protein